MHCVPIGEQAHLTCLKINPTVSTFEYERQKHNVTEKLWVLVSEKVGFFCEIELVINHGLMFIQPENGGNIFYLMDRYCED